MTDMNDTIAAIGTAEGEGGIGIIRISGPDALGAFKRCFARLSTSPIESHRLYFGHVIGEDGRHMDEAMGVYMRAPGSYTRQDVCELHCHGGRMTIKAVLNRVLSLGVRLAEPGEFTKRAFLNGRIGLSEAEAVMELIGAGSEAAARSALQQLEGGVSRFVLEIKEQLLELLSLIEAGNDFPEEIEEQASAAQVLEGALRVRQALIEASDARSARIVREGLRVVLVGKPNVGKSSLMNAMLRQERAIVTDTPGTTRDVLTERMRLGALRIELSDTAGQRDAEDEVERIGVRRALEAQRQADVILLVLDASNPLDEEDEKLLGRADRRTILVLNKTDLASSKQRLEPDRLPEGAEVVSVCALSGEGIDRLLTALNDRLNAENLSERQMTSERHIECAKQAVLALDRALETIKAGMPLDLASVDLMQALRCLTDITGESASEDVIARIFERFCVGK